MLDHGQHAALKMRIGYGTGDLGHHPGIASVASIPEERMCLGCGDVGARGAIRIDPDLAQFMRDEA
jgi:hypothetical protein